jgi:hypothetical protein
MLDQDFIIKIIGILHKERLEATAKNLHSLKFENNNIKKLLLKKQSNVT